MASDGKQVPSGTKRARERSEGTDRSSERRGNWEGKSRANKNEKRGGEQPEKLQKRLRKKAERSGRREVARRLANSNSQLIGRGTRKWSTNMDNTERKERGRENRYIVESTHSTDLKASAQFCQELNSWSSESGGGIERGSQSY
jgi:hypothetical protein